MTKASPAYEAERRLALLKAAFREVAERGFSAVTLEDIAVRAGVSKGVTLYYFDSKEDLFRELFAWLIDSIHARMRDAVAGPPDPVGKIRALVALIFPSPSKNRAFFRAYIDFCGLAARKDSFREISERFYSGCREIDRGIVEEGMRRGAFRVRDAAEAASTLRAIFDGLMLQWLAEKDPEGSFAAYRERCERELLNYLSPPANPPAGLSPSAGLAPPTGLSPHVKRRTS
jgi:TetR/AcrR family fatty acid metabolism transcriptional regulator